MNVTQRLAVERKVIRHLIRTAKAHGYVLTRIWDGECNERPTTEAEALDVVFSVDTCTMRFKHPDEPASHCAVIVLGNDGWDCIADSSTGGRWDAVMDASSEYADKFCK